MSNIFQLPPPKDQWQFTVEVLRRPDGGHVAVLVDARTSLIEAGDMQPHEKLSEIADILAGSVDAMRANAAALKP